jgi:2-dehydro-3-deoxy-D-gluconate 5-dehydrogenase
LEPPPWGVGWWGGILTGMSVLERFRLDGKVALVTGASHGIGEGLALALAEAGADVALASRSVDELKRVAGRVQGLGRRALVVPTDVADLSQVEAMVARTAADLGEPDVLLNVAGVNRRKPILEVTPEDWDFVLNVNLRGLYFASQAVARRLVTRRAGWGRIIHIASMTSFRGFATLSLYAITKSAVVNLTKTQAVEWAQYGIRVSAIAPGWIETPMTAEMNPARRRWVEEHLPQGHYGAVEDLAGAAVYLASPASDYTTGQTFAVDAGFLAGNPWPTLDE